MVLFTKAGTSTPPVSLNLFKNLVGLVLFSATLFLAHIPWNPPSTATNDWLQVAISGVIGIGVADSIFFAALNRLKAGNTAIVESLYSPFVVLLAGLLLAEPMPPSLLASVALMTLAVVTGTSSPRKHGRNSTEYDDVNERRERRIGIALGVTATFLMAAGIVIVKPVLDRTNAWWIATIRLGAGTVWLTLQALLSSNRKAIFQVLRPSRQWRILVPAGIIGCYLATITWVLGMQKTFASRASVLNQSSSLMVVLLAAVFLKEKMTWRKVLGVALAIAGAVLVTQS